MARKLGLVVLIAAFVLIAGLSRAEEEVTPIIGRVLSAPTVAWMSDGKFLVNYELVIANATSLVYTLKEIKVVAPEAQDAVMATLGEEEIPGQSYMPGAERPVLKILPSQSEYVRINLVFNSKEAVPKEIVHIITAESDKINPAIPQPSVTRVALSAITPGPGIVIGPPLKGAGWVAVAVDGNGYHRNTVMPINGDWVAPERWAVDWIQLDGGNRLKTGDVDKNESYPQYGKEILAVADGVIDSLRDGMPDIPAGASPKDITIQQAAGNYIMQDIGGGNSALYAHLQPGSLRVKKGDTVKKGDVIALLGNSGNTTGPHLHFHIVNGKYPLGSQGVPYAIDSFTVTGTAVSNDDLETQVETGEVVNMTHSSDGPKVSQMPADLSIVEM